MRRREPPRVVGPYPERGRWRIFLVEEGKRKSVFLVTEAEALRARAELERKVMRPVSRRLGDVLDLWEQEQLRRGTSKPKSVCEKVARVPIVCTHSLRGLHATLAVQSGAASHAVAASLGHGSFAMTQRHYAQASSVQNAATARVLSMLDAPVNPGIETARALAEHLRARLDGDTRAHLASLLVESDGADPCPA